MTDATAWRETTLGALASISRGASPRPIASSRWFDPKSDVRWVRIADVNRSDGRTLRVTTQALSADGIARSRFLKPGSLIMSIAATVGIPVITGVPTCIHDGFVALENLKADQRFLLYLLKASESKLREAGQSGSQMNVNTDIVRGLAVRIPEDRKEQERIAETLWDLDDQIVTLERLIIKKQAIKQGMLQRRFALPRDVQLRTSLGAVATLLSGGTPDRSNAAYWSGDIPWISATTLKRIEVTSSDQCVTDRAVRAGSKMAPLGSTLMLVRGSALHSEIRAALVTSNVCFNQDVKALVPSPCVESKFLTYSVHANASRLLRLVTSAGNTAGVLDTKILKSFEIWLPDREIQRKAVSVIDDITNEIDMLTRRLDKACSVKQGMMQRLLTGRSRLPAKEGAA